MSNGCRTHRLNVSDVASPSEDEIRHYAMSRGTLDKAGAYGIQGAGSDVHRGDPAAIAAS